MIQLMPTLVESVAACVQNTRTAKMDCYVALVFASRYVQYPIREQYVVTDSNVFWVCVANHVR